LIRAASANHDTHENHETTKTVATKARRREERSRFDAVTGIENRPDEQTQRRTVCSSDRFSMPEAAAARRRVEPAEAFFVVSWLSCVRESPVS